MTNTSDKTSPSSQVDLTLPWMPSVRFMRFAIAMLMLGSIAAVGATLVIAPDQNFRIFAQLMYGAFALLGWYFLSIGKPQTSRYILALGTWLVVTVSAFATGGVRAPVMLAYPALIIFMGWIFGRRLVAGLALATALAIVAMTVGERHGLLPQAYPTSPTLEAIIDIIIIGLAAGLIANLAHSYQERMLELQRTSDDLAHRTGELEEAKQILNQAQAVAKVGSWVYDFRERKLELSAEASRLLNLPQSIAGDVESFLTLVHTEDRDEVHKAWLDAVASGRFESKHRVSISGELRWLSQTAQIERSPDGRAQRVIGIVHDITDNKLAKDSLVLSEQRFSTAFHSSPIAASISRPTDGYFIDANRNYERFFGWTRDELIGRKSIEIGLWLDQTARQDWLDALRKDGRVLDWRATWRHKSGEPRDVSLSAELVEMQGETCVLAYIVDITEHKKGERELRDNQRLLRTLIDQIPDPIILKDENARFLMCNVAVAKLYQTTPEAMIGKFDADFGVPREMDEFFRRNVLDIMASGELQVVLEDSRDALTGELRHFRSIKKPFKTAEGKDRIIVIAHDITDIVQSMKIVAENEKRLQEVMDITQEGVWDWHVPSDRVQHNIQWYRVLGLAPGECPDTRAGFDSLIHDDDRPRVRALVDEMLTGGRDSYRSEHRLRHASGEYLWINDRGRIVERDDTGNPLRIAGSFSDITERKSIFEELKQHKEHLEELVFSRTAELATARDAAEQANRAKSQFLASMSHELRTPMNAIMGMTNLALRHAEHPQQIDWLHKSLDATQHLLDVINDILDVSRIEANRVSLEQRPLSPAAVVREAAAIQLDAAAGKGLRLKVDVDPALPDRVSGDAMRIRQIVINFLGNAIKFSDLGEILVRAMLKQRDSQSIILRLEVIDQGIGITPEQQAQLFQPFSQVEDPGHKRGGTGLGLAICKRIANLMGGDVGVISREGYGSTFWAELHLKTNVPEAGVARRDEIESARDRLANGFAGTTILVAEDDDLNLEVTVNLLKDAGLVAHMATNGEEALELCASHRYALILMDVQMPVMNGLDATRAIRRMPGMDAIPIMAMTANAFVEDRERCLAAGMNSHLSKPFQPESLFSAILAHLEQAGSSPH